MKPTEEAIEMIFGDPFRFAILIQRIPEWSNADFNHGLFHFLIDGEFLPSDARASTLWVDVYSLLSDTNALFSLRENKALFELEAAEAFKKIHAMTDPEFQAATENIADAGYSVFAVSSGENVRVLGARHGVLRQNGDRPVWVELADYDVKEAILSKNEIKEILTRVARYFEDMRVSHPTTH